MLLRIIAENSNLSARHTHIKGTSSGASCEA